VTLACCNMPKSSAEAVAQGKHWCLCLVLLQPARRQRAPSPCTFTPSCSLHLLCHTHTHALTHAHTHTRLHAHTHTYTLTYSQRFDKGGSKGAFLIQTHRGHVIITDEVPVAPSPRALKPVRQLPAADQRQKASSV
jgi:hypothetical protein